MWMHRRRQRLPKECDGQLFVRRYSQSPLPDRRMTRPSLSKSGRSRLTMDKEEEEEPPGGQSTGPKRS